MQMPNDPNMLLSYVNLKLRDFYSTLEDMCEDLDTSQTAIEEKLKSIGYQYDSGKNQFVCSSSATPNLSC